MNSSFSALVMAFLAWISLPSSAFAETALKQSIVIDASQPEEAKPWGKFEIYEFPANSVAPHEGNRKVFFGNPVELDFEGLPEGENCEIKASFLGDSERKLAIEVNGTEIESNLEVPQGKLVEKSWIIPSSRLYSGKLGMNIMAVSGPNAVLQHLEILTVGGKKLTPGKRAPFQVASSEDLEQLVMPLPKITPRPAVVTGTATPLVSLNGTWEFSPTGKEEFKPIQVPGEWKMQGFNVPEKEFAVYRKKIDIPADWKGRQIRIRFDAVHAVCEVSLNGRSVGGHEGGFVPFELDLTDAAKPGEENELIVKVQSESVADTVSCISQYAAHQVGGLIRKVTLMALPEVHLAQENSWTTFDGDYTKPIFHYETEVFNASQNEQKITLQVQIKDAQEKNVASNSQNVTVPARSYQKVVFDFSLPKAHLWTSETPYLYTVNASLKSGEGPLMNHVLKAGLKQVEIKGNQVFVNGNPVKLFSVCHHEVHPLRGRSLTPELCRKDAELYRAGNVNCIRTSHYPPSEEFLQACDELGLFVESEAAVCWIGHGASPIWKRWNILDSKYFPYFLRPNLDQLAAYRNHPSIIMWSLANESYWTPLWAKVFDVVKRHEPHRPFAFHDQCMGGYNNGGNTVDIANYHYPSENNPESWNNQGRPLWFGEYVHLQCYNRRELATDPWIREDWGRPVQRMVDLMWEQPGCLGGSIWSGIDDVFHMPDGTLCGYGHWGPIDAWRREKPEYHGMKMAYTPFRVFSAQAEPGKSIRLSVQNRQNFLNFSDTQIKWTVGKKSGNIKVDLAPHQKGEITIPGSFSEGTQVTVTVTDPRGCEIGREVITVQSANEKKNPAMQGKPAPMTIQPDSGIFTTGALSLKLPVPMILPLNNSGGASGPAGSTLANEIEPFTPVQKWTWTAKGKNGDAYQFSGEGEEGSGSLEITPRKDGSYLVKYTLVSKGTVDPRQWGLVFELPKTFDTITWDRNSQWSWYPEDQIGRPKGSVKANPVFRKFVEEPGVEPKNPWSADSNELGSNDFRSTKGNIRKASLSSQDGVAFSVLPASSEQPQSVRAWNNENSIRFLVAGFNTGGYDHFFNSHYSKERRPIQENGSVSSEFIIQVENRR